MTTNPGPEYFLAQEKYEQAKTSEQKLAALQEMLKYVPKHKASERMVAELTSKIARVKQEAEKEKEHAKKSGGGPSLSVKKDGAGQVAIIGLPNTGKSTLLKKLTGVDVAIAPYPFTTTVPVVGMMDYNKTQVQLVEIPALIEGSCEGKANGTQLLSLCRNADALIILYSTKEEGITAAKELEAAGIIISRKAPRVKIQKDPAAKGIVISGTQFLKIKPEEVEQALKQNGIHKATVILEENTDMPKLLEALHGGLEYKNALILQTYNDFTTEQLKDKIFALLQKIIVYTKKPGEEAETSKPLVLPAGSTITAAAELVHKDIAKNLKYAKVWGSTKFPGQRVAKDYELKSGDIIEFSA